MLQDSPENEDDLRLARGAAAGEPEAVAELLRRLRCVPLILTARNRRLGNPLDAALLQDLAQDCLLAIWTRLDQFGGHSSLESWVYRFCLHKHLALVRDRGRRMRIEAVASPLLGAEEARAEAKEPEIDPEVLHEALAELDRPRARVVRMKHFEDLTFEAIGERLRMSPNTAKTLYYRGLKALREALQRRGALPA